MRSLQKTLQTFLSKLKKSHTMPKPQQEENPSNNWILSSCKYPKTPSFSLRDGDDAVDAKPPKPKTPLDIDGFLFHAFNSAYIDEEDSSFDRPPEFTSNSDTRSSEISSDSNRFTELPPDLPHALASERFFATTPGMSHSILDDARASTSSVSLGFVAVPTHSPDPYDDFRRSMQEMVEARDVGEDQVVDWEFLQELLFCYLKLNEKASHEFILRAFFDLLMTISPEMMQIRETQQG